MPTERKLLVMTNRHQQLNRKIKKLFNMITHSYQTHGFLSLCQLWLKYAQKLMLSYLLYLSHNLFTARLS
ncbi:hypothetical protein PROFUN_16326 [Planoprotostelium fungivorum]|uniref:Uncharacterized protein n=1 Tax=Planoprotostelium fungivorum TaxID=1890364 RepID=A0A2P6MR22_9EUKA|nr:hypothetical protein PROFUN_16326 [Planoprotostelium fungivorum]